MIRRGASSIQAERVTPVPTKFNASQTEAICAGNRNILVSAAAGSGKTTVMVEKIKETLIRDQEASISQFLVITFTKAAAAEQVAPPLLWW